MLHTYIHPHACIIAHAHTLAHTHTTHTCIMSIFMAMCSNRGDALQHAATHRATHGNSRHHADSHGRTLQHTATHCWIQPMTLQHTATHCNTLQHTAAKHTATHCNTLQHTAMHCNTLQHDVTLGITHGDAQQELNSFVPFRYSVTTVACTAPDTPTQMVAAAGKLSQTSVLQLF